MECDRAAAVPQRAVYLRDISRARELKPANAVRPRAGSYCSEPASPLSSVDGSAFAPDHFTLDLSSAQDTCAPPPRLRPFPPSPPRLLPLFSNRTHSSSGALTATLAVLR